MGYRFRAVINSVKRSSGKFRDISKEA